MARYQLRSALRLDRQDGQWLLHDQQLGRTVRLGDLDAKLVRALEKGATRQQLVTATGLAAAEVLRHLQGLARLYLLQGRRSQRRIALHAERKAFAEQCNQPTAAEPLEWPLGRQPPQHGCVGTGGCCGGSFLGPLSQGDRQRVSGLAFGSKRRFQPGEPVFETVAFAGREHTGMSRATPQGQCVAQGEDRLCDIHREHGAVAKPAACQLFPLRMHRSPRGIHVSLLLACDGYHTSRDAAQAWAERAPELRGLLQAGAPVVRMAVPLEWRAGVPASVDAWWILRNQLYALESEARDPHAWLAAVLRHVHAHSEAEEAALREDPELAVPGDLARLAEAVLAPTRLYDPAAADDHAASLEARAADLARRGHQADAARLRDLAAGLRAQIAGEALQPHGTWQASAAARQHLVDIVANDLQLQVVMGQLDAGLHNLARRLLLAEALACALARRAGRDCVSSHDTTRALHVVYRSEPDLTALAPLYLP